jgi:hypothetical protein
LLWADQQKIHDTKNKQKWDELAELFHGNVLVKALIAYREFGQNLWSVVRLCKVETRGILRQHKLGLARAKLHGRVVEYLE